MTEHNYVVMALGVAFSGITCPACGSRDVEMDSPETEIVDDGVIGYGGQWSCGCGANGTYSFFAELKDVTVCDSEGKESYIAVQTPYEDEEMMP